MNYFAAGLVDRLTKGLDQRLQERRAQQQQQLLFEQQLQQQQQAQPQRLQMMEDEAVKKAEIEKKIREDFSTLPAVDDQEYLEAMQKNDLPTMMRKAAENPKLNAHLEQWWKMVGKHSQMISGAVEKEKAIQSEKTKGYADRMKLKPTTGGKAGKAGGVGKPAKMSERDKARLKRITSTRNTVQKNLNYAENAIKEELLKEEPNYSKVSMLRQEADDYRTQIEELAMQERVLFEPLPQGPAEPIPGAATPKGKQQPKQPVVSKDAENFMKQLAEIRKALAPK